MIIISPEWLIIYYELPQMACSRLSVGQGMQNCGMHKKSSEDWGSVSNNPIPLILVWILCVHLCPVHTKWEPGTGIDAAKWCINWYVEWFPDEAMEKGEQDVKRVLEKQRMMEEAQTLQKFQSKKEELDQDITREIEELALMSENCDCDMMTIGTILWL